MAVSFKIEFLNDDALTAISDIETAFEDFESYANMDEDYDEFTPTLIVSTAGAELELENFMWDVLTKIQNQATANETDYTDHA